MAHYAQIDNTNTVIRVLVIDQDTINTGEFGDPATFIQTSYNTRGGVHYGIDGLPDGGVALRKNFAATGMVYDHGRDAFYMPQPYASWTLNETTCEWEPPVEPPAVDHWGQEITWDEVNQQWVKGA